MWKLLIIIPFVLLAGCKPDKKENLYTHALFPVKEYGKWGYINPNGKKIIECKFDEVQGFSEGLAPVQKDSLWGFIDSCGVIMIEPRFHDARGFSDGLALVTTKNDSVNQNAFINKKGRVIFTTAYEWQKDFSYNRALIKLNNQICFIDKTGKIVIKTDFPFGSEFVEGVAKLWRSGHSQYIDTTGQVLFELENMGGQEFSEGLAAVRLYGENVYVNKTGHVRIDSLNQQLVFFNFSDGLAKVTVPGRNSTSGFMDKTKKLVIPIKYDVVIDFKEGLAAFRDSEGWGFINKKGDTLIAPQFKKVDYQGFKNGLCYVKKDRQWGYINPQGKFVWKEQIDIQYQKIDLTKWKLDTLKSHSPLFSQKYAGYDNQPRVGCFSNDDQLKIHVDTTDLTVYADKYFGYKIYLVNGNPEPVYIPAQDGEIEMIQQALNKNGEWQDTEHFINSFCGNSYHSLKLLQDHYKIIPTPITTGNYKTKIRFKLELKDTVLYSNVYSGKIKESQFVKPDGKIQSGISIWSSY